MTRNGRAAATDSLVGLTRALVKDYDVLELVDRLLREALPATGCDQAALAVLDHQRSVEVLAATSESARDLDLFQAMADEGPCIDSIAAGQAVTTWSGADTTQRWPAYAQASAALGFRRTISLPLRIRGSTLGALNLFGVDEGPLDDDVLDAAQAFADVSTLAIIHHRLTSSWDTVAAYLQGALNQRVTVEVAKGVLVETASVDAEEAGAMLLAYARDTGQRLGEVAAAVVEGGPLRTAVAGQASAG